MKKKVLFAGFLFLLSVGMVIAMGAPEGGEGGGGSVIFSVLPVLLIIGYTILWVKALIRVIKALKQNNKSTEVIVALILLIVLSPIGIIVTFAVVKKVD